MTTAAPIRGFSHIQLAVRDVPTAVSWYSTALGLERLYGSDDGSLVALVHPDSKVVVVLCSGSADRIDGGVLDHLAFGVADGTVLQAWAKELTGLGIAHPGVVDERGKPSLILTDPDGNQIELVAPAW